MKITNKQISGNKLNFNIDESPAYVNAIRRYSMSNVPVLAIEDIEFKRNEGILYDEMVAHRMGLIPLKTDLTSYRLEPGKITAGNSVKFTLKAQGPSIVYSGDLKLQDPAVIPVHDKIPVLKLLKDQEVELSGTAIMGIGKDHAKWSPGMAFYQEGKTGFDFSLESWGQLAPDKIIEASIEAFNAEIQAAEELFKKL